MAQYVTFEQLIKLLEHMRLMAKWYDRNFDPVDAIDMARDMSEDKNGIATPAQDTQQG
jgi:hypothetical protein